MLLVQLCRMDSIREITEKYNYIENSKNGEK